MMPPSNMDRMHAKAQSYTQKTDCPQAGCANEGDCKASNLSLYLQNWTLSKKYKLGVFAFPVSDLKNEEQITRKRK